MAASDDFIAVLSQLKGETVSGPLALKVAQAFVYAYPGEWEKLVTDAGFVIENADPIDPLSVGTYSGEAFTPITTNQLNNGMATHALNKTAWFVKHITRSQWKLREAAADAGDTPADAEAKAEAAAQTTADSAADDARTL